MYDIAIIGGGPAGLTAALYALRAGKKVLIIEKSAFGGQITFSPKVENIPGFTEISGNEFAEKMVDQVISQGGEFEMAEVTAIRGGEVKILETDAGEYRAKAVIIATGAKHRVLGLDNEQNLIGNGISFCAVCDGAFFAGKTNLDRLTGEDKLVRQLQKKSNVEVLTGCTVQSYVGDRELSGIVVARNGKEELYNLDGLFLAVGLEPQNGNFASFVRLDERGYIDADESCMTSAEGVFTAGDCRRKKIRQVATAAADGAVAALAACDYIDNNL